MIYKIENLSFTYPSGGRQILKDISFNINEGDIISVLGPNGAGKSTLLNCMMGLLKPQSGNIFLNGKNIASMRERDIAKTVAYVAQTHTPAFSYTVEDFVLMGVASRIGLFAKPSSKDRDYVREALDEMNILHLAEKPYTEISGGERQQATIARAMVQQPQIILFDEPTAHLDFGNQLRTLRLIKKLSSKGYAIVITTHNPDHALLLENNAALLDKSGNLTIGSTDEIINEAKLSEVYNTQLKIKYIEEENRRVCIYPKL